jgi:hypothetical protein
MTDLAQTQLPGHITPGPARRLAEELEEDGVELDLDGEVRTLVLEELDHARRVPVFEGRRAMYGSFVLAPDRELVNGGAAFDIVDLSALDVTTARTYADGRAAYLVRQPGAAFALACFDRLLQYEVDVVRLQEATGAQIIQRTAVLEVPRLFLDGAVIEWNGRQWDSRPTASAVLPTLRRAVPQLDCEVARHVLELAVHWLSPGRIGATIVIFDRDIPWASLDTATASRTPDLSLVNRRHFPALFAALRQFDLATVVSPDGSVRKIGVGLRFSAEADAALPIARGMRHRSAQRFSYDHPTATVVVVSEDGPVSIFRDGVTVADAG